MAKIIILGIEARNAAKIGMDIVANSVKSTLGPGGKNVLIRNNKKQPTFSTKDGVTVAKSIELEDPIEDMGASFIKDVAEKTAKVSGDGTTTATILAQEIITDGLKCVSAGANAVELKQGIDKAVCKVIEHLKTISEDIGSDNERIKQVATISANGDTQIGGLIAEAFAKVGNGAHIIMEDSRNEQTSIRYEDGFQFDRGMTTRFWETNNEKMIAELNDPWILLYDGKIERWADLKWLTDAVIAKQKREILIIAEDVDGQARDTFITNKINGVLNVVCVVSPAYGERRTQMMEDIAILTGATFISPKAGQELKNSTVEMLGTAERVFVTKDITKIIGGAGSKEKIEKRIGQINSLIEQSPSDMEVEMLAQRLSKLKGEIAVLSVGGNTEIEIKERKFRVEDAIRATNCALEEGIVPGGGTALIRCIDVLDSIETESEDERTGVKIVQRAIQSPLKQICQNVGKSGESISEKVKEQSGNIGYNARTHKIEDLMLSGVIDPTKVVRDALENAASVAGIVIISECLICEVDVAK